MTGAEFSQCDERAVVTYLEGEDGFREALVESGVAEATVTRACSRARAGFVNAAANLCESPIEQMMLAGLVWENFGYRSSPVEIWDCTMPFARPGSDVVIAPQFVVGKFRIDLAVFVTCCGIPELKIAVECDGHAFHEKTKEQAARDKKRDRTLQTVGWRVFRFTGSEIWRSAADCAEQVGECAYRVIVEDLRRRGMPA